MIVIIEEREISEEHYPCEILKAYMRNDHAANPRLTAGYISRLPSTVNVYIRFKKSTVCSAPKLFLHF